MSASIPFFKHLLSPALITVSPPSVVLSRLSPDPTITPLHDIDRHTGEALCEIIVLSIENAHRQQQMALVRDAYRYLVALHHLPAGTTIDPWWDRLCAVHDSTELKKAVFIVAALLRKDDTLLLQYVCDQFFPLSYLRHCLLPFVQSQGDHVLDLFRQAKCRWQTLGRPLTLAEFNALYDGIDVTPHNRARSSRLDKPPKKEAVTTDPYHVLQVPHHATDTDIGKALHRRKKQLVRDTTISIDRYYTGESLLWSAVKEIEQDRRTRLPFLTNPQDERLELLAQENKVDKKRKMRPVQLGTSSVPAVLCDTCRQDCVNDDKPTVVCNNQYCVRECHVDCLLPNEETPWSWICPQCVLKHTVPSSTNYAGVLGEKETSAKQNHTPTPTADNSAEGLQTLLESVDKQRDQPVSEDERNAEKRLRLRLLAAQINEDLPIVDCHSPSPRSVPAATADAVRCVRTDIRVPSVEDERGGVV